MERPTTTASLLSFQRTREQAWPMGCQIAWETTTAARAPLTARMTVHLGRLFIGAVTK
jgi:hypothetical protein